MKKPKTNAEMYKIIVEKIIKQLEAGHIPWRKGWACAGSGLAPMNLISKNPYRGINVIMTAGAGYASPYWVTFNQAHGLGGHVKKGEVGTPIIFWKMRKNVCFTEEQNGEDVQVKKDIPLLRFNTLFNTDQCELPPGKVPEFAVSEKSPAERIEAAEAIIAGMPKRPVINHGGNRAGYYERGAIRGYQDISDLCPNRHTILFQE